MVDDIRSITQANKAAWEASARLHETGKEWDDLLAAAAKPEFSVLDACLTTTLQGIDINGRNAVQIGCNNARELLSLASLGAVPALGIDQSESFLKQGQKLAELAGQAPLLLEADIYDLPENLGTYDLVLITIGVLNWMPDLQSFFEVVRRLMSPHAMLVIYETHPFMEVFDPATDRPHEPSFSYFDRSPQEVNEAIAYDGLDHGVGETGYWFIHSLGDILTSAVSAGLRIRQLTEHAHTIREPEYDIYCNRKAQIPMSYTLVTDLN
ncbi:class I SAM-dependent methyltransferase [Amylibacter sp. SFDW26]|uniref:class I SAM-dependent methyltransferase n=1 Tax=Amylibacter sp. SFDW26 TaxID=2652722 RepID=UPI001261B5BA|nr:class I SAM-dependent methyltransferase [Amylibacter sp. SFDW26]KAB7613497.1 class I SAM-dependent methyltransferase [Amylibacter sp. SFDW26]